MNDKDLEIIARDLAAQMVGARPDLYAVKKHFENLILPALKKAYLIGKKQPNTSNA